MQDLCYARQCPGIGRHAGMAILQRRKEAEQGEPGLLDMARMGRLLVLASRFKASTYKSFKEEGLILLGSPQNAFLVCSLARST